MNDADRLGRDPAMRWIVGGKPVERGGASTSQMGRFETELLAIDENPANFMRMLALPDAAEQWSLTTPREKLIEIGARIVRHGRCVTFQIAEVVIPRDLFADILCRIDRLGAKPAPP